MRAPLLLTLAAIATMAPAASQDLTINEIGLYQGVDDYLLHGIDGNIAAYSFATTACNVGDQPVEWSYVLGTAPILGKNAFRIIDGRIEQIGYSFVKYGGCANDIQDSTCGTCQPTPGDCTLGIGCADIYWSTVNDGKYGYGKWELDPVTGSWPIGGPQDTPTGSGTIRGRVQIDLNDFSDPSALYIVEGQYIAQDDHLAGNAENDYAWRQVGVDASFQMTSAGPSIPGQPAIYAWQALANDVHVVATPVIDEGGPGVHGWIWVGSRAIDLGGGEWRYEYAIQNGNSGRAVGSFGMKIPCDGSFNLSDDAYRGVLHHSGSPYLSEPWSFLNVSDQLLWRSAPYASNPDASALRWGELGSFGFTCNRPPVMGKASVGLFTPGTPTSVSAEVFVPSGDFPSYCTANANSTGVPAQLSALGSPHVEHEALSFEVTDLPTSSFGYFLMSQSTTFVSLFGGSQGNLCVGAPQIRFSGNVLFSGSAGEVGFDVDFDNLPQGLQFMPGDAWNFQYWYRDVNPSPTSNTTAGVTVTFCP